MKYLSTIIISTLIIAISCSNSGQEVTEIELNDYMDTVSYSVGVDIGKSFRYQEMNIDPSVLAKGLDDAFNEKDIKLSEEEYPLMGCNVLATAPRSIIMLDELPKVQFELEKAQCKIRTYKGIEISRKGEGGPTCLTRPLKRM